MINPYRFYIDLLLIKGHGFELVIYGTAPAHTFSIDEKVCPACRQAGKNLGKIMLQRSKPAQSPLFCRAYASA
jgi:hypothetical protein